MSVVDELMRRAVLCAECNTATIVHEDGNARECNRIDLFESFKCVFMFKTYLVSQLCIILHLCSMYARTHTRSTHAP